MAVPKLRFKEFDGDWDTSKIDKIASVTSGGTPSRANPEYWNGDIPWVTTSLVDFNVIHSAEEFITKEGVNNSSAKLFPKDTILMAMYGQGITRGKVAILGIEATTNQACCAIKLKDGYETQFIFQNLMNRYDEIRDLSNDGGQKNLSAGIIKDIEISIPSKGEQTKIATFLSAVDEKISQLSQKHQLLNQYKQGMMQKLFSQQIRFKADDGSEFGEWINKTIGDVANIKRGASPRPINDKKWFDDSSKIGWVRISDVSKSTKYLLQTEQYLSALGIQKSRLVPKGNLIMSICATIGKPIYTGFDVCIHDGFVVFSELQAIHEYAYYYLEYIEKNWYQYGQPGTQVNLNSDIVSNEDFPFPCLEEQTKIANFLSAIDQKIDDASEQLEQAKLWKKGLLQQMFV